MDCMYNEPIESFRASFTERYEGRFETSEACRDFCELIVNNIYMHRNMISLDANDMFVFMEEGHSYAAATEEGCADELYDMLERAYRKIKSNADGKRLSSILVHLVTSENSDFTIEHLSSISDFLQKNFDNEVTARWGVGVGGRGNKNNLIMILAAFE